MKPISYTAARSHLAETMQKVCENHAPVMITRAKAESVIMMSLSDYEAMQETNYLLQSPVNAARLAEAIKEIENRIEKKKRK